MAASSADARWRSVLTASASLPFPACSAEDHRRPDHTAARGWAFNAAGQSGVNFRSARCGRDRIAVDLAFLTLPKNADVFLGPHQKCALGNDLKLGEPRQATGRRPFPRRTLHPRPTPPVATNGRVRIVCSLAKEVKNHAAAGQRVGDTVHWKSLGVPHLQGVDRSTFPPVGSKPPTAGRNWRARGRRSLL